MSPYRPAVGVMALTGRFREISPLSWVLVAAFLAYYLFAVT